MNGGAGFHLDWDAGPSAQLELFARSGGRGGRGNYQLKFIPPFRSTIRPPIEERPLGRDELEPINQRLDELAENLGKTATRQLVATQPSTPSDTATIDQMTFVGKQLLDLLVPWPIQAELRGGGFFLEIGMDEALLEYPWELMNDGENFLCLKHFVGRSVNAATQSIPPRAYPTTSVGSKLDKISILVISVPRPESRETGESFEALTEAQAETNAIAQTLAGIQGLELKVIRNREATYDNVYDALRSGQYDIIHFNGHAIYDDRDPFGGGSGLVLYDRNMIASTIANVLGRNPPILCFMNACETGRTTAQAGGSKGWKTHYSIFGLARAFLLTGSYLLGSRWKLGDQAAAIFATNFYSFLLKSGKSLGYAITEARKACFQKSHEDQFSWASYVFYGDPRLCFRAD